jgi:hypothetical protein
MLTSPGSLSGFVYPTVSNDVLISYNLPLRPDKETFLQQHARWEQLMARPLTFIHPEFEILERHPVSSSSETDLIGRAEEQKEKTDENRKWSGDVDTLDAKNEFKSVGASWAITRPYPPYSRQPHLGWGLNPQAYACAT